MYHLLDLREGKQPRVTLFILDEADILISLGFSVQVITLQLVRIVYIYSCVYNIQVPLARPP